MVNNGSLSYDHDADGTHTELSGCEAQFRNKDYDTFISIRYHENTLKVSINIFYFCKIFKFLVCVCVCVFYLSSLLAAWFDITMS